MFIHNGQTQHDPSTPEGFSYKLLARSGQTTTADGFHPSDPDGIGVFEGPNSGSVLIRNHENSGSEPYPVPVGEGITYDPGAKGGTSTISVDADGNRIGQYTSVAGTSNNCAGGISPWGTWLTCEETEARAGSGTNTKDHGYVFEVDPASRESNLSFSAIPLKFLGRHSHEAVAVDPATSQIYLTEDAGNPNGLYLRWTPPAGFTPAKAGSTHSPSPLGATSVGTRYKVEWVDVPDRDARTTSVREQFTNDQITRSRKLEGQWWGDGGAYFVSSNITVAPQGGLILAEDGNGVSHLVGVTDQGMSYPLARNEYNGSEFCGPAFSKDGKWLFANIQSPGFTLAVTGPWTRPSSASDAAAN